MFVLFTGHFCLFHFFSANFIDGEYTSRRAGEPNKATEKARRCEMKKVERKNEQGKERSEGKESQRDRKRKRKKQNYSSLKDFIVYSIQRSSGIRHHRQRKR